MLNLNDERIFKNNGIVAEYGKRKSQMEIADMFDMNVQDVSYVTQLNNYRHTIKITPENRRDDEKIMMAYTIEALSFLDKYPIENFQ